MEGVSLEGDDAGMQVAVKSEVVPLGEEVKGGRVDRILWHWGEERRRQE